MITSFVFLIEQLSRGLYLIGAVGILFNMRGLMLSRRDVNNAEFELERELASRRQAASITWTLGLIEIMLGVFAVTHVIAPTLRSDLAPAGRGVVPDNTVFVTLAPGQATVVNAQGTPVNSAALDDPFLTLTAQPASDAGNVILATPTISPTPPGTIQPNAPPVKGCTTDDAMLQVPANGQVLFESVTVIGTAKTANFTHYRFEFSGASTGNVFAPYGGDKTSPVTSPGVLGQLALTPFGYGTYLFQLTVFDQANKLQASCTVTIYILPRPPTPTPPGGAVPGK